MKASKISGPPYLKGSDVLGFAPLFAEKLCFSVERIKRLAAPPPMPKAAASREANYLTDGKAELFRK